MKTGYQQQSILFVVFPDLHPKLKLKLKKQ